MKKVLPYIALAVLMFVAFHTPRVGAYPKPSVNKVAWELDFTHGAPTRITVKTPGGDAPQAFWYMTFKVTNNTTDEREFLPVIELVDDKGNVHRSDQNISATVFDAIKQQEGSRFLEPLAKASGRLLQGPEQARDSVAIWPEPLERMGSFTIFVNGLSGEAVFYKDGKETPFDKVDWTKTKPDEAGIILRKTLELDYQVPGDEFYQGRDPVIKKDERWVMR
ncbi:MAG TPA: hypothetical protein VH475_22305 [Tepidisphaeraceae bacterium]